jgi:hypothetical protein
MRTYIDACRRVETRLGLFGNSCKPLHDYSQLRHGYQSQWFCVSRNLAHGVPTIPSLTAHLAVSVSWQATLSPLLARKLATLHGGKWKSVIHFPPFVHRPSQTCGVGRGRTKGRTAKRTGSFLTPARVAHPSLSTQRRSAFLTLRRSGICH